MNHPPALAQRILKWYAGKADLEDIQGDLDEVYGLTLEQSGKLKADFKYWTQVLSLLFSYGLKKRKSKAAYSPFYYKNSIAMLKNYFKIAIRNFAKQKSFTIINMVGLALGMSVSLLALGIAVSTFRFDEFHEKKERTYQINTFIDDGYERWWYASTFNAMGDHLKESYPFIEEVVRVKKGFNPTIQHHGTSIAFDGYFADHNFFDVFTFEMVQGNPATALQEPNSIVLTERVAETIFREKNPLEQVVETQFGPLRVTGVVKEPKESHLAFKVLTSFETYELLNDAGKERLDWKNYRNNYVYTLLPESANKEQLENALAQCVTIADEFGKRTDLEFRATRVDDVVPQWLVFNNIGPEWDLPTLLGLLAIGMLILLPAVFNYTNLSIARALRRAKEIGVRKVVGADKRQIKVQFIVETVLLSLISLVGGLVIYKIITQEFLKMAIGSETLNIDITGQLILAFILFAVVVGIISGLFPALYFSKLSILNTLKGEVKNRSGSVSGVRKGLFVFQFLISMFFIIGVGAVAKQYTHVFNYNLGFQSENMLAVPFHGMDKQLAINELSNHPDVAEVTTTSILPGLSIPDLDIIIPNGKDTMLTQTVSVGDNFFQQMNIDLFWGETFEGARSTANEKSVIVNQRFMRDNRLFDQTEDSLRFTMADGTPCRIVGILKDFNFEPLSERIDPLLFIYSKENSNYALLKLRSDNIKTTIDELDEIWRGIDQDASFEARFLDQDIEEAYDFLVTQIKIFSFLSAMAITICSLGLLGMVAYTTENRTKEIAIRKIMGASNYSLYYTLTRDFIKLIAIASIIGIPLAYLFYDKFFLVVLMRYGKGLGALEVIIGVIFLFAIGFGSIFWQTGKIARANPATKLRYE